jgi:hypothetical protein
MELGWSWQEVSGKGTIYSYEIVHHAIQPGFKDVTPYAVVLIELDEQRGRPTADEGLRIIANLVRHDFSPEAEDKVAIGKRVQVVFQDLADHMALPQFILNGEPDEGRAWRLGGSRRWRASRRACESLPTSTPFPPKRSWPSTSRSRRSW